MRELVNPETLTVLDLLEAALPRHAREHFIAREWRDRERPLPAKLAMLRAQLLFFNHLLREYGWDTVSARENNDISVADWLTYLEEHKVIPVYDEAVALMRLQPLVQPREVEYVLKFMSVSGSGYAVDDVETHGFGYHFHFGRVKRNTLTRFNVVLTFDCNTPKPPKSHDPLFAEEHGSGRYQHIDVSTVGHNIRYPIYLICEKEMANIGRDKFKLPSKKASIFY